MKIILILLLLFPLGGAVINAVVGRLSAPALVWRWWPAWRSSVPGHGRGGLCLLGVGSQYLTFWPWIKVTGFSAPLSLLYDPLAAIMALMVTFVSSIIHLYSVAFMRDD